MSNLPIDKIDYMARVGFAGDLARVNYYVQAMVDPFGTVRDTFRRDYAADVLNKLLNIIAEDNLIYDHIISHLQVQLPNRKLGRSWMGENAKASIERKAEKSGIPVDILLEVYDRAYDETPPKNLTREQYSFNAVNSFIAEGAAWRKNPDLRLWATDSLTNIYKKDTPYQPLNTPDITKRTTFKTIKKVIKK